MDEVTPTGWDTGLSQDYDKGLSRWFASRVDARHTIRRWFGEGRDAMKTDRELLELAAKAIGLPEPEGWHHNAGAVWIKRAEGVHRETRWNPLEDDGDALRLAVALKLQVTPGTYMDHKANAYSQAGTEAYEYVHSQQDMAAATRRAIVRAAASIGEQRG